MRSKTFVSLFAGCGGLDLGFIGKGFVPKKAYDINPAAVATYNSNLLPVAEIRDLSVTGGIVSDMRCDVVVAGPPCQGFSTIGKRSINDPRNELLIAAGKLAIAYSPKVIIIENVRGAQSGEHYRYWQSLEHTLKNSGYKVSNLRLRGVTSGVPQLRTREIMVAWNTSFDGAIDVEVIHGGVLGDVLSNMDDLPNHEKKYLDQKGQHGVIARRIKQGQKLSNVRGGNRAIHTWDIPEVFGATTKTERLLLEKMIYLRRSHREREFGDADPMSITLLKRELRQLDVDKLLPILIRKRYIRKIGNQYDLANTFNGKYRRLSADEPSLTVDTRFGEPQYFLHPSEDRGFTLREAARIQGFPDSFEFTGSLREQFVLVGNAVPPQMGGQLAELALRLLN